MAHRSIPLWLRHAPTSRIRGFAVLAGIESAIRGLTISVFPMALYKVFADKQVVASIYFWSGLIGMIVALSIPYVARLVPRRWLYLLGVSFYLMSAIAATHESNMGLVIALWLQVIGTASIFVCFNAYVLDFIERVSLGHAETRRLFYSALGWTVGPFLGVWLYQHNSKYPFYLTFFLGLLLAIVFTYLRLGNGKNIQRAKSVAVNPLGYLSRFFAQPRLIAGWLFAVLRSCGWWVYIVYIPIYTIENGLSETIGGTLLSLSNATLFATPFLLKLLENSTVRIAVRRGFLVAGLLFICSIFGLITPWLTLISLYLASIGLIYLDLCGGLPFLMAVRPFERTEMSAVYSSYRDVSGFLTPAATWIAHFFLPLSGIFILTGGALLAGFALAGTLPVNLGRRKKAP